MKKVKKIITSILAGLVFTCSAFAVTPQDIFLNYGGEIQPGDMIASASLGTPWVMYNAISNYGWAAPSILGEFEYALPIGPVPFTVGGYLSADFRGSLDGYYGYYDEWGTLHPYNPAYNPNGYYYDNTVYGHCTIRLGGLARYHICIPPVPKLDFNIALKMGLNLDFSNWWPNKVKGGFDFGMSFGVSFMITDKIGIRGEVGYPYGSVGAIFKL